MRNFFLIISISLCLNAGELGVVIDNETGLEWQDDYSDNGGKIKKIPWKDALVYCKELNLGSEDDWRLPNINELRSIVNRNKYEPSIDSSFKNTSFSTHYWSSTTYALNSSNAWFVYFGYGTDNWDDKTYEFYVRCVRGGE